MTRLVSFVAAMVAVPVLGGAACRFLVQPLAVLSVALFVAFLAVIWRYNLEKKMFLFAFPLMLVSQALAGWYLAVDGAAWDMAVVVRNAKVLAEGGNVSEYFAIYPNNIAILCVFACIFRLTQGLLGSMPEYSLAIFNIVLVDASVVFTMCVTRRLFDSRTAWLAGVVMLFFAPFYLFIPIHYTDSLALFFVSLGLLFAIWLSGLWQGAADGVPKRSLLTVLGGIWFAAGLTVKGVPAIVMIALCVQMFCKLPLRRAIVAVVLVFAGFVVGVWGWNVAIVKMGVVSRQSLNRHQLPPSHWVMMGLKGAGAYDESDFIYTESFQTYAEKKAATEKEIVRRVRALGVFGLARHVFRKVIFTWTSETCGPEAYLELNAMKPVARTGLRALVLDGGRPDGGDLWRRRIVRAFCRGVAIFVLLFAAGHFLMAIRDGKGERGGLIVPLTFVGGVLFFVLWETHPRYTFSFMPTLLILATSMFSRSIRRIHGFAANAKQEGEVAWRENRVLDWTKGVE